MTKQPVTHASKANSEQHSRHSHSKASYWRPPQNVQRLALIYAGLIILTAVTAGVVASAQQPPALPDPFGGEQRSLTDFRLYYPTRLPGDYYLDIAPFKLPKQDVVTLRIMDAISKHQAFTISQQSIPENFDFDAFYASFGNRSTLKTKLGDATAGTIDNGKSQIVSLKTNEKTWILVQAPTNIPVSNIRQTLNTLTPSR